MPFQVERQSLKRAVMDAQQRLHQAEAASKDAEAASQTQQDALATDLTQARCPDMLTCPWGNVSHHKAKCHCWLSFAAC